MIFFYFSCFSEIVTSRWNFFIFIKISYLQRFRLKKKRVFRLIIFRRTKKWFFLDFSCFSEIVTSRRNFFVFIKISYLQRFGFKKKRVFLLVIFSSPKKECFWIFLIFFKSSHQDETFLFLPKFHIFNGLDY